MIAVDTNILVYAHRQDSAFHKKSSEKISELAESGRQWAIAWPCIHEFLAIVTHPRIYNPPTPIEKAIRQIESWMECPTLHLIGESGNYWPVLKEILTTSKITGPQVHDGRVAAICRDHNVTTLWSADRDFSRMGGLKIENPLKG